MAVWRFDNIKLVVFQHQKAKWTAAVVTTAATVGHGAAADTVTATLTIISLATLQIICKLLWGLNFAAEGPNTTRLSELMAVP